MTTRNSHPEWSGGRSVILFSRVSYALSFYISLILASTAIVLSSLRTSAGGGCPLFLAILLAASLFLGGVLPGAVRRSLSVLAMAAAVEEAPFPTLLFTSAFTSLSLSRLH